jgi:hypothetical protein
MSVQDRVMNTKNYKQILQSSYYGKSQLKLLLFWTLDDGQNPENQ